MDSISISNYRNFEQETLKQNGFLAKKTFDKKSFFITNPEKDKHEEHTPENFSIINEPKTESGQKLNFLA